MKTADDRAAYAKRLADNDSEFKSHMSELDIHVKQVVMNGLKRRKCGGFVGQEELDCPQASTVVSVNSEAGLELRKRLGILWPADVYERATGRKPKPNQLTKIVQGGETLTGILRPRSDGMEVGCTEVFDVKKSFASTAKDIANSEVALNEKEISGAWKRSREAMAFDAASEAVTNPEHPDEPETQLVMRGIKRKGAVDDFDDLMDFDTVGVEVSGCAGDCCQ